MSLSDFNNYFNLNTNSRRPFMVSPVSLDPQIFDYPITSNSTLTLLNKENYTYGAFRAMNGAILCCDNAPDGFASGDPASNIYTNQISCTDTGALQFMVSCPSSFKQKDDINGFQICPVGLTSGKCDFLSLNNGFSFDVKGNTTGGPLLTVDPTGLYAHWHYGPVALGCAFVVGESFHRKCHGSWVREGVYRIVLPVNQQNIGCGTTLTNPNAMAFRMSCISIGQKGANYVEVNTFVCDGNMTMVPTSLPFDFVVYAGLA